MRRAACKDWAEASCLISNLLAELEQPCRICREDSLVLTGRSPTGETAGKGIPGAEIVRGPNIGAVPVGTPLPKSFAAQPLTVIAFVLMAASRVPALPVGAVIVSVFGSM